MSSMAFYRLFLRENLRMSLRRVVALREQSLLMITVILLFVIGYWVAGFLVFEWGFMFLAKVPGLGVVLVDRLLYMFFAFLFLMLVFSNMIIGYSTLFRSQETQWMLSLPVRHTDVFRWKAMETALLASWAFLFLSVPLLLAYGSVRDVAPSFYLKAALLFVPFTVIAAAVGALVILVVTRYLRRRMFKWALFGVGAALIMAAILLLKPIRVEQVQPAQMIAVMHQLLRNSQIAKQPLLPSYWVASGMIAWGEGWAGKGTFFFLLLLSNALMAGMVCMMASARLFYEGWSRSHSQGNDGARGAWLGAVSTPRARGWLERSLQCLPGMHPATRALMLKDIRVFWRDTSQWSQFVIFFGLLALYVLNLRNIAYHWQAEFWGNFIAFLNLGTSSMTLATLTTRFVYPQFSLEGKRLWIVGMVPDGLKRVVLEKFWLSSAFSITITLGLTLTSCAILRIPLPLTLLFAGTIILMSFSLCSIAVGIGVLFPNFGTGSTANRRDDNPARVVSGFGGTFCFVLSMFYIVLVVGAEAFPMYSPWAGRALAGLDQQTMMIYSWLFVSTISLIAISLPMALALKKVEKFEL
jgi:ABC-2 type transport system permease protein